MNLTSTTEPLRMTNSLLFYLLLALGPFQDKSTHFSKHLKNKLAFRIVLMPSKLTAFETIIWPLSHGGIKGRDLCT